jgi:hypothetical protein
MSEFDLNPEEPNFEDINASLAGNFSQKDEENKLDGYNNFSTIAQISTGADSELLQEKKEESQKEINDGFIKINKIGEIKVEESIEDKTSIKIEEEKEDAKVKETEQIKIDDNLNKNDKNETKNEIKNKGKNFILKRDLHSIYNFAPSRRINYYSRTQNYLGMEFIYQSGKVLVFEQKKKIGNRLFVYYRDLLKNQQCIINYIIGNNTPNSYYK